MAEATFYPDASPESTSVDGYARRYVATGEDWATIRVATGTDSNDSLAYLYIHWRTDANTNKWDFIIRPIIVIDISALQALGEITVDEATFSIYGYSKTDTEGDLPNFNVYSSAPNSNTAVIASDLTTLGATPFCDTPIAYGDIQIGDPGNPNAFVFNAAGLAAINAALAGDGILKLGLRNANYDVAASSPTWTGSTHIAELAFFSADKGVGYKPKLVIKYTPAAAAKTSSDTGSGVDAYVSLETPEAKISSDIGSGVEGTPLPSATLTGNETGAGIEALASRLLASLDTGSSIEVAQLVGLLKDLYATELGEGLDLLTAKIEMPTKGGGMKLWT